MRLEVWDLRLGTQRRSIARRVHRLRLRHQRRPARAAACGWGDFRRCRPEPSGLREVYFRYDDELEYWARANNLRPQMEQFSGTKTYGFPITVSALIDDDGSVRGIRVVSDPRFEQHNRDEAYLLRNFLTARFGREGWACEKLARRGRRDPGRRHLRQGALPQGDRRAHHRVAGDAPPAQGRAKPDRSAHRPRDHRAVRELSALRAGAGEVERGSRHILNCHARVSGHPVITGQAFTQWSGTANSTREFGVY